MITNQQTCPDPTTTPTLSISEAAGILGISGSAYKAVHAGDIPTIRIGQRYLVPTAALAAMLNPPVTGP